MLKKFRHLETDVFVYEQDNNESIRLLQHDKLNPLSYLRDDEGNKPNAVINCSYFARDYVLGRNQGDLKNDTYADGDNGKWCDLVIYNDGTWKAGKFNSWDYRSDNIVAGFSPVIMVVNGTMMFSDLIKDGKARLTTRNPQTAIAITKENKLVQIVTEGRNANDVGLTGQQLFDYIDKLYPSNQVKALLDGGGSSEMIVNGKIVNYLSDGHERPMLNGLALIKPKQEDTPSNEEPDKKMFTERLNKDGIDGGNYWYNHDLNPYAQGDLWMPNCTNYAWGRSSELANKNLRKDLMGAYPNAKNWYANAKWKKGTEPRLGAIGVWDGELGHVAVVEDISDDYVVFSQSNYFRPINKNSPKYFETRAYTPKVGEKTLGVDLPFLGYIYNPYVKDNRTTRNEDVSQVEVLADLIRVRKSPNGEVYQGRYCLKGIYNILETKIDGDYTWAKLDDDIWIALNDKSGWTKTYLKEQIKEDVETLREEITLLEAQIKALKCEKEKNEQIYQEGLNTLKSDLNKAQSTIKSCNEYASFILNLTKED